MKSMQILEEMNELLSDAQYSGGDVSLHGSGRFINARGDVVGAYDILIDLHKKQDAIDRSLHYIKALMSQTPDTAGEISK